MNSESKLSQLLNQFRDQVTQAVQDSPLVQQLKSKFDELEPRSRNQVTGGAVGGILLLIVLVVVNASMSVRTLKQNLAEKNELVRLLQSANEDLRRLKEEASLAGISTQAGGSGEAPPAWNAHFETTATSAGIQKDAIAISGEKAGTTGEQTRESLFDITLKKVNLRQLARFATSIESGSKPVKIRNLTIDAKPDGSAWLDATVSVSAFSLKPQ